MHTPLTDTQHRATTETLRLHRFLLLLASVGVVAALAVADPGVAKGIGTCTTLPIYVLWIHSDLRARGVRRARLAVHLLVALIPVAGLLFHFFVSRGRVGVAMWIAAVGAIWVAAAMGVLFGHVVIAAASGRA